MVCLGDVALTGPRPQAVVERLRTLGWPVAMGNCDAWLTHPQESEAPHEDAQRVAEIDRWCLASLSEADLNYLRSFQSTIRLPLDETQSLLCFHGSPRSPRTALRRSRWTTSSITSERRSLAWENWSSSTMVIAQTSSTPTFLTRW